MFKKLIASVALAAAVTTPVLAESPKEINFGIIATESSQVLKQNWQPLLDDMSKQTGIKVNAFFAPDYAGVIEGMRFNKVQVGWFGNKSAMEAVDRSRGEIFAKVVAMDGSPGYWSLVITHKDSPYKTLDDLVKHGKDINFGIGDPNSTSGFLVPSYYVFALNHIDPKTHFKTIRAANHETNLMAVINKQVDMATNNTENWEKFSQRFPEKLKELRIIWKSPLIPADPMVWREDLDHEAKAKIKAFFLTYGSGPDAARELAILSKINYKGFSESNNNQLLPIRQLELFKQKSKIAADGTLSASDKQAKIQEIDQKLGELNQKLAALK
ncbi:MAG: phosphonate ABC transporter substrate-binding protein [Burkholderiaceae bacterium]|nr:phosphonate ABC transporter substrate-binding protein [Sulfuritalea sp.]MCF8173677.1 phosphonate ABC transporter substrate-binding protein [Burkholderiaceae bacterium]MCF8184290.1 phosphonate ABC transporter substrate-binding protein [Polynucleobacter sp.]